MNPIVSIIIIFITLAGGGGLLFYLKIVSKKSRKSIGAANKNSQLLSANELINVKDIRDRYLYTRDNSIITYFKIQPISIDLLSANEKKSLARNLTGELKGEQQPFRFLAVSRPIDITPLLSEYTELMANTRDRVQKTLLRNEIMVMSNYALSGEVIERQFYILLWQKYDEDAEKELAGRQNDLIEKFEGAGIRCEIIRDQDIVKLCNLVNNPAYTHIESSSFEAVIPLLSNH